MQFEGNNPTLSQYLRHFSSTENENINFDGEKFIRVNFDGSIVYYSLCTKRFTVHVFC